jgi:hypothetical protein
MGMSEIIGYGEDALTYRALTKDLDKILAKFNDTSDLDGCMVFYRPSFGRGGKSKALFGEFDAIIITETRTYLVESKWDMSSEVTSTGVNLTESQIDRHKIFRWYVDRWDSNVPWPELIHKKGGEFSNIFSGKTIPPEGSELTKNLQFILRKMRGKSVIDLLLLFCSDSKNDSTVEVYPDNFKLVVLPYIGMEPTNYFKM